jgi:hypothetical protein
LGAVCIAVSTCSDAADFFVARAISPLLFRSFC